MSATISKEEHDICEMENSNLRRCLAWAATHLPPTRIVDLRDMIKRSMDDGGIVDDLREEARERVRELHARANALCDFIDRACSDDMSDRQVASAIHKAATTANILRGLVQDDERSLSPNLYDVRNAVDRPVPPSP